MKAILILTGLTIGNLGYEFTHGKNYLEAVKITYFQAVAVLIATFIYS